MTELVETIDCSVDGSTQTRVNVGEIVAGSLSTLLGTLLCLPIALLASPMIAIILFVTGELRKGPRRAAATKSERKGQ